MEEAITKIPPFSIEVCDAMTEGSIGFMLEKAIINELRKNSVDKEVATLLTQIVVERTRSRMTLLGTTSIGFGEGTTFR